MDFNKQIPLIEKTIGYTFKDKSLLIQSFTRSSFCNERNYGGKNNYKSNEVLEFFGDSILSAAIISIFLEKKTERYEHGIMSELCEGDFSNLRSKLSDKRNLSKSTAALGLEKFLIMGEGDEKMGIANEPSVMEDLFESIIGAVYIDCSMNMKTVIGVVKKILDTSVYFNSEKSVLQSSKNALQEFCADKKRRLPAPVYKTVGESGPDHRKEYERACFIGTRIVATGKGKNQKLADSAAAEAALEILKKEEKPIPKLDLDAPSKLKSLTASKKSASPEWRDLGETENSRPDTPEFAVECRALGKSAVGAGRSKAEARAKAAEAILSELMPKNTVQKKHAPKKTLPSVNTEAEPIPEKTVKRKPLSGLAPQKNNSVTKSSSPKKKPHWQKKRS